jgi:hypothetical protein
MDPKVATDLTHYTLTGAADWTMLATVGGASLLVIQMIIMLLIATIYKTLPKHTDLQKQREALNDDLQRMAKSFEAVLERHIFREQAARESKDDSVVATFEKQRSECSKRFDRQFNEMLSQIREIGKQQ